MRADCQARRRASFEEMREEMPRASKRRVRFIQTASTMLSPNIEPASDAAKIVKTVSLVPRNAPSFNNIAYLGISRQYLSDDLHWIEHRPLHYLKNTTIGLRLWLLPAEQFYATVELGAYHLGGYTTVYDSIVLLQPVADPYAVTAVINGHE